MFELSKVKYKGILNIERLNIPSGKITSIVGESGSGKTTLLRLLNKLISPDYGTIFYQGKPLEQIDSVSLRRSIVMLPQTPVIFPGSVKENLEIGLKFSEKPLVPDNQLLEVLNTVHLQKELSENAENLSGGEKQRLALGRIILMNPDVFLLDEPSSALDEETEQLVIEKTVALAKENEKTLIMVTHTKKIAQDFSDNTIEIKRGQLFAESEALNHG